MSMQGQSRFNQMLNCIEDSNPKTLSARLKEMEKTGLITRTVYDEVPIRVEYKLTKKGKDLQGREAGSRKGKGQNVVNGKSWLT